MHIESTSANLQKTQKELYALLTEIANFKSMLPDNIVNFKAGTDSFSFSLKGMPVIQMVFVKKTPYNFIQLKASADYFLVFLSCHIDNLDAEHSKVRFIIDADINPMMQMLLKKPLQKLVDTLAEKMSEL